MAKIRNPHLIPTGAVATGFVPSSVNLEKVVTLEYGTNANELNFNLSIREIAVPIVWKMSNQTVRNAEFTSLAVSSTNWAAGTTQLPFVKSSVGLVNKNTGIAVVGLSAINLDKVTTISKIDTVAGIGGAAIYQIVFQLEGIDYISEVVWSYAGSADRNTVYTELTNNVAGMTFL